jgi:putative oxidoreductase
MAEVRHPYEVEDLSGKFARVGNGSGRPRWLEAETADSRFQPFEGNDTNWGEVPTDVNISSPWIRSSKQPSETSVLFAIGRIAIAITFIMSALFRLMNADANGAIIASNLLPLPGPLADAVTSIEATLGLPFATALVIAGAMLESGAGVLIAMGILIRPASIVLLIFAAIGFYESQWDFRNGVQPVQIISALKEVSIVGALLILFSQVRLHRHDLAWRR